MEVRLQDAGWRNLYTAWAKEGRASQFERIEEETGCVQRWTVLNRDARFPVFLLKAASEGVEVGNERPPDWMPSSGYSFNRKGGMALRWGPKGYRIVTTQWPKEEDTVSF